MERRLSFAAALVLAVAVVTAGALVRVAFAGLLGERATFIFFVPAVVAAAAFSGWRAGLAAGVLGSIAGLACDRLAGLLEVGSLRAGAAFLVIGWLCRSAANGSNECGPKRSG